MLKFIAQPIARNRSTVDTHFVRVLLPNGENRYVGNLTKDGAIRLTRSSRYDANSEVVREATRRIVVRKLLGDM